MGNTKHVIDALPVLNRNVFRLREAAGMTQQQFADSLMVKRTAIGSYDEGRASPTKEFLKTLFETFNLPKEKFFDFHFSELDFEGPKTVQLPIIKFSPINKKPCQQLQSTN